MGQFAYSALFRLFHQAILRREQVICTYQGYRREVCPIVLGHKAGRERVLVYQFAGDGSRGPVKGEWKCLELAKVKDAKPREGRWYNGDEHRSAQRCVDEVFIDANIEVANQPGRRAEIIASLR